MKIIRRILAKLFRQKTKPAENPVHIRNLTLKIDIDTTEFDAKLDVLKAKIAELVELNKTAGI